MATGKELIEISALEAGWSADGWLVDSQDNAITIVVNKLETGILINWKEWGGIILLADGREGVRDNKGEDL